MGKKKFNLDIIKFVHFFADHPEIWVVARKRCFSKKRKYLTTLLSKHGYVSKLK